MWVCLHDSSNESFVFILYSYFSIIFSLYILSFCGWVLAELSGACLGSGEPRMGIRPTSQSDKSFYTALAMAACVSPLSLHSKVVKVCCAMTNQSGICGGLGLGEQH